MKIGRKFGRLTVLATLEKGKKCQVQCQCGIIKIVTSSNLYVGQTKSCGCLRLERITKHKLTNTPTHMAWTNMIGSCYNPNVSSWVYIGYYKIKVYDKWLGKTGFQNFLNDMGERPSPKHRLSRLNKKNDFIPSNTYWATLYQCNRNKINNTFYEVDGVKKCLIDWAKLYNIPKSTLHYRVVTIGMKMKDALRRGKGIRGKYLI